MSCSAEFFVHSPDSSPGSGGVASSSASPRLWAFFPLFPCLSAGFLKDSSKGPQPVVLESMWWSESPPLSLPACPPTRAELLASRVRIYGIPKETQGDPPICTTHKAKLILVSLICLACFPGPCPRCGFLSVSTRKWLVCGWVI